MAKKVELSSLLTDKVSSAEIQALDFETGVKLLEELVAQVEAGSLPLEQSISAYEKGVLLLGHLRSLVSGAETKLEQLQLQVEAKK